MEGGEGPEVPLGVSAPALQEAVSAFYRDGGGAEATERVVRTLANLGFGPRDSLFQLVGDYLVPTKVDDRSRALSALATGAGSYSERKDEASRYLRQRRSRDPDLAHERRAPLTGSNRDKRIRSLITEAVSGLQRNAAHLQETRQHPQLIAPDPEGNHPGHLVVVERRPASLAYGAALARALFRSGDNPQLFTDEDLMVDTAATWLNLQQIVDDSACTKVSLCGVTFLDSDPERALEILQSIGSLVDLTVWTYRWPDGFQRFADVGGAVRVAPFEILQRLAESLSTTDQRLIRLGDLSSTAVRLASTSTFDRTHVTLLAQAVEKVGPGRILEELYTNPSAHLNSVGTENVAEEEDLNALARSSSPTGPTVCTLTLASGASGREERVIDAHLQRHFVGSDALAVAELKTPTRHRLILARKLASVARPSVRYLLHEYHHELEDEFRNLEWLGPENSLHLDLKRTRLTGGQIERLKTQLFKLAEVHGSDVNGERQPSAAVSLMIYDEGRNILHDVDFLGTHNGAVQIKPQDFTIYLTSSPRDDPGAIRQTLSVNVVVGTAEAAGFLYRDNGFVISQLESRLEGVLKAARYTAAQYLRSEDIPGRVRLDVDLSAVQLEGLKAALREPSTKAIPMSAVPAHRLTRNAPIRLVLDEFDIGNLIVYAESQTIGPSIAYAYAARALLSEVMGLSHNATIRVLDVFAGSGLSANVICEEFSAANVVCVDLMTAPVGAGSGDNSRADRILWLQADAVAAIAGRSPILSQPFTAAILDPPHGALLDMLLGTPSGQEDPTFFHGLSRLAPTFLLYGGHRTQALRLEPVIRSAQEHYSSIWTFDVDHETFLVGLNSPFDEAPASGESRMVKFSEALNIGLAGFGWRVRHLRRRTGGAIPSEVL